MENSLDLNGIECEIWEAYIDNFKKSHVKIKETKDELVWSKNPSLGI